METSSSKSFGTRVKNVGFQLAIVVGGTFIAVYLYERMRSMKVKAPATAAASTTAAPATSTPS